MEQQLDETKNISGLHEDQQSSKEIKEDQPNKTIVPGDDSFDQMFTKRTRDIHEQIRNADSVEDIAGGDFSLELNNCFSEILQQIQELSRRLEASKKAKIKYFQSILNMLTRSCDESRQRLTPKKKFFFGQKDDAGMSNPVADALRKEFAPEELLIATQPSSCTIENRQNAHICLDGADVRGKDISISNLHHCLVELQGFAGSIQIKNANDCIILCGPVSRSLLAEHCERLTIGVACQQLRLRKSTKVRVYLHVTSGGIIEDCNEIEIATYNYDYENIETDFEQAGLDKSQNKYTEIADFNWVSPDDQSPNWTLLKDIALPNWSEVRRSFKQNNIVDSIL